jgi:hypothetical protein
LKNAGIPEAVVWNADADTDALIMVPVEELDRLAVWLEVRPKVLVPASRSGHHISVAAENDHARQTA